MKKITIITLFSFLLISIWDNNQVFSNTASFLGDDRCNEWASTSEYEYLFIKICEYESGGSGYYQFRNNYNKHIRFSYKIFHRNGKVTSGSTNIKSGEIHRASCFSCAEKNGGGNKSYEISNIYFEGEKGYW